MTQRDEEIRALRKELARLSDGVRRVEARLDRLEAGRAPAEADAKERAAPPAEAPSSGPVPPAARGETRAGQPPAPEPPPIPKAAPARPRLARPARPPRTQDLRDAARRALKRLGPKEEMSWEMALGTYWLPRIGIVVLAVGVVWLASLAVQYFGNAWWMPYLRVGLGYAICVALLYAGRWLERRETAYARILYAGGIAVSYFITFAMHYIPYTRLFDGPAATLLLLAAVVLGWGVVAQWRRSMLVALATAVLGHLTVAVSTLTLPEPSRFAVGGLLLLSLGSAFFLARNRWYLVGAAGMVGAYANHFFWLARSAPSESAFDFIAGMAVLASYFLVFALAELFAPDELRRRALSTRLRTAYASFNTAAYLLLSLAVMQSFDFARGQTHWLYFGLAAVLLVLGRAYWKRRGADPLLNAYFTKAPAVAAIGLAVYFEGATLTLSLAVEAVVLLMAARRSGLVAPRAMALGVAVCAFAYGAADSLDTARIPYADPAYLSVLVPSAVAVAALLVLSALYQRTGWTSRTPGGAPVPQAFRALLWQLDLIREPPYPNLKKPLGGLALPWLYAVLGVVLAVLYALDLAAPAHRGPVLLLVAVAITAAGVLFRLRPLATVPLLPMLAGWLFWNVQAARQGLLIPDDPEYTAHLWYAAGVCAPLLVLAEFTRLRAAGRVPLAYVYAAFAVQALAMAALTLGQDHHVVLLAGGAVLLSVYAWAVPGRGISAAALGLAVVAAGFRAVVMTPDLPSWEMAGAFAALVGAAVFSETRYVGARAGLAPHQSRFGPYVAYLAAAFLGIFAIVWQLDTGATVLWLCLLALFFAVSMLVLHPGATCIAATVAVFFAAFSWYDWAPGETPGLWRLGSFGLIAFLLALDRYYARRHAFPGGAPGGVLVVVATLVSASFATEWAGRDWQYFWWLVAALGFLGYGGLFRKRTAAATAVLLASFATVVLVGTTYPNSMPVGATIAGYTAAVVFWLAVERGHARFAVRGSEKRTRALELREGALAAIPAVLLVLLCDRVPVLRDFYLTVSWTGCALLLYAVSLLTRQKYYRYAGLGIFFLALARVILIDTRQLEGVYRILSWIVLGAVLLAVAYGYIYARRRAKGGWDGPNGTNRTDETDGGL